MTIFIQELKQLKFSTLIWSISLVTAILLMLPVYIDMLSTAGNTGIADTSGNLLFETIGTNLQILSTPIGTYAFLTLFIVFALAIRGMNTGLTVITKEYRQNSADFLLTKPFSRTSIYFSKLAAAASSAVIIGILYAAASWITVSISTSDSFSRKHLILIALSSIFIQLIFIVFGMLIGIIIPRLINTLTVSTGTVFISFASGSFSLKTGISFFGLFSPIHYFNGADIILRGTYDMGYISLFIALLLLLTAAGHHYFRTNDVTLVS